MKAIFSLRRHSYLRTIGVFLIAIVLIAGVVGCEGEPGPEYDLTMAVNPTGTGTATDETGTSPYAEGTNVDIKAVPAADCYRFANWTAPDGTFGDANNATTTFTMPARNVTVTANFEPALPPDHYKFYEVDSETAPPYPGVIVQLEDQFGTFEARVGDAVSFGNPAEKVHADITTPIVDDTRHYTLYELVYEGEPMLGSWQVTINNQFQDDVELTVTGPYYLAVPTQKEDHEIPGCLNHYLVYEAWGPVVNDEVVLSDQFIQDDVAVVYEPYYFANPVQKTVAGSVPTPIEDPDLHWVLYDIWDIGSPPVDQRIQIDNQFGPQTLDLLEREFLAVPSQKISWEQPLNHFRTYYVSEGPPIYEVVQLEDQFVTITANVTSPLLFANPVEKQHGEELTQIWDPKDHLMFYGIDILEGEPQTWEVTVDNQFGIGQELTVGGPIMLAVPTEKDLHGPPDLDHFLVYEVLGEPPSLHENVWLWDQFTPAEPYSEVVYQPMYFAVPAQKTHGPVTTPIEDPDDHLLLYDIGVGMGVWEPILHNQFFGPEPVPVYTVGIGNLLGVPSQKTEWSLVLP